MSYSINKEIEEYLKIIPINLNPTLLHSKDEKEILSLLKDFEKYIDTINKILKHKNAGFIYKISTNNTFGTPLIKNLYNLKNSNILTFYFDNFIKSNNLKNMINDINDVLNNNLSNRFNITHIASCNDYLNKSLWTEIKENIKNNFLKKYNNPTYVKLYIEQLENKKNKTIELENLAYKMYLKDDERPIDKLIGRSRELYRSILYKEDYEKEYILKIQQFEKEIYEYILKQIIMKGDILLDEQITSNENIFEDKFREYIKTDINYNLFKEYLFDKFCNFNEPINIIDSTDKLQVIFKYIYNTIKNEKSDEINKLIDQFCEEYIYEYIITNGNIDKQKIYNKFKNLDVTFIDDIDIILQLIKIIPVSIIIDKIVLSCNTILNSDTLIKSGGSKIKKQPKENLDKILSEHNKYVKLGIEQEQNMKKNKREKKREKEQIEREIKREKEREKEQQSIPYIQQSLVKVGLSNSICEKYSSIKYECLNDDPLEDVFASSNVHTDTLKSLMDKNIIKKPLIVIGDYKKPYMDGYYCNSENFKTFKIVEDNNIWFDYCETTPTSILINLYNELNKKKDDLICGIFRYSFEDGYPPMHDTLKEEIMKKNINNFTDTNNIYCGIKVINAKPAIKYVTYQNPDYDNYDIVLVRTWNIIKQKFELFELTGSTIILPLIKIQSKTAMILEELIYYGFKFYRNKNKKNLFFISKKELNEINSNESLKSLQLTRYIICKTRDKQYFFREMNYNYYNQKTLDNGQCRRPPTHQELQFVEPHGTNYDFEKDELEKTRKISKMCSELPKVKDYINNVRKDVLILLETLYDKEYIAKRYNEYIEKAKIDEIDKCIDIGVTAKNGVSRLEWLRRLPS
jgi:hypothetical protein